MKGKGGQEGARRIVFSFENFWQVEQVASARQLQNVGSDGGLGCLQASLSCKDYGLATGRGEKSSARCTQRDRRREKQPLPKPDLVRIAGRGPKIIHPKTTTGIMRSEAVEEGVRGEKNRFVFKIFV